MGFITVLKKPEIAERIPILPYLHDGGFAQVFGGDADRAQAHLEQLVEEDNGGLLLTGSQSRFKFGVMVLWGDEEAGHAVTDFVGYSDFRALNGVGWQASNPTREFFAYRGMRLMPQKGVVFCEDVGILEGRLGQRRRMSDGLIAFTEKVPGASNLDLGHLFRYQGTMQ